jgi:hypothetical protein
VRSCAESDKVLSVPAFVTYIDQCIASRRRVGTLVRARARVIVNDARVIDVCAQGLSQYNWSVAALTAVARAVVKVRERDRHDKRSLLCVRA